MNGGVDAPPFTLVRRLRRKYDLPFVITFNKPNLFIARKTNLNEFYEELYSLKQILSVIFFSVNELLRKLILFNYLLLILITVLQNTGSFVQIY